MKILVFSDSHSDLRFMRRCVEVAKPDAIIHLGDHYSDGEALTELYPHIPVHQVVGNCDMGRCPVGARQMLCYSVGGVMMYMCHGHNEHVKMIGVGRLVATARRYGAQVALYGHTHRMDCHREEDGLLVMNPGSAGYGCRSAGLIKTDGQQVTACYFITQEDLEEMQ